MTEDRHKNIVRIWHLTIFNNHSSSSQVQHDRNIEDNQLVRDSQMLGRTWKQRYRKKHSPANLEGGEFNTHQIVWISSRCFQIRFCCKCWFPVAFVEPITSPRKTMKNASSDCFETSNFTQHRTSPHFEGDACGLLGKKKESSRLCFMVFFSK